MAEEDTVSPAVSEKSESGERSSGKICVTGSPISSDKQSKNDASIQSSYSGDNVEHLRRYSISKPISPKIKQKISPRYLRASTGSCHDFCKYGIKHGSEENDRPWRIKVTTISSGKLNHVLTVASIERKKSTTARSMSFPVSKSALLHNGASSDAVSSVHPPEVIKGEIIPPQKKFDMSSKQAPSSGRRILTKGKRISDVSGEKSPEMRESSSYSSGKSCQTTQKPEKRMNYSSHKLSPSYHPEIIKARLLTSAQSQPEKASLSSSLQASGSSKGYAGGISKGASKSAKMKSNLPFSVLTSGGANKRNNHRDDGKISEANRKSSSSWSARPLNVRGKKGDDVKTRNDTSAVSSFAKKKPASPRSSLSSKPSISRTSAIKPKKIGSLKLVSPVKDQNRMLKAEVGETSVEDVPEKSLHVVETETKAKLPESTKGTDNNTPPLTPQSTLPTVLSLPQGMSLASHEEVNEGGRKEEVVVDEDEDEGHKVDEVVADEVKGHKEDEAEQEPEEEEEEEGDEQDAEEDEVEEEEEELQQQQEEMETEEYDDEEVEEELFYESDEGDELVHGDEILHYHDLSTVEVNHRKPLRNGYVISDSKDPVQVKLRFKRGKVIDVQSDNQAPRRLRFRRGRIVEENDGSKSDIKRRNFNRRSASKDNSNNTNDAKIVLRHQDLEEKKDAQGLLLNNVIEETASKLVESRKSKVKALVGAFETVISLQDDKSSAQLVA